MDETEVRVLVREEIRKAFEELSERADFWRDDGELKSSAAYVLSDAADNVAEKLLPPAPEPVNPFANSSLAEVAQQAMRNLAAGMASVTAAVAPEPVNPFAPKHTAQEWADRIRELIRQAEADGYQIWCDADGSVSSTAPIAMRIGTDVSPIEEDPTVWRLQ